MAGWAAVEPCKASEDVLAVSQRTEVHRVDATPIVADVVDLVACRHLADEGLVGEAVRGHGSALPPEHAVAVAQSACPVPAGVYVAGFNLVEESIWKCRVHVLSIIALRLVAPFAGHR